MTEPEQQRVAVIVYLTAEDEETAAHLVAATLRGKATIDGRHLSRTLHGQHFTAEVAAVETLSWSFGSGQLKVSPGREPYRYKDDE